LASRPLWPRGLNISALWPCNAIVVLQTVLISLVNGHFLFCLLTIFIHCIYLYITIYLLSTNYIGE